MCKTYSCIVTKDYSVLDHPASDNHEQIIVLHNLSDMLTGAERTWVRAEILPQKSLGSLNMSDWYYQLDQEKPLPNWYNEEMAEEYAKKHLLRRLTDGRYTAWGGNLYLADALITSLGNLTSVGGDLYLTRALITQSTINAVAWKGKKPKIIECNRVLRKV